MENSDHPIATMAASAASASLGPLAAADCPATSSFLPMMVSIASLIGCLYVIVTYCYVPALRQHPAGIMFGMSVYGAIYQFLFLLDRTSTSVECSQMALFVDFFLTGQETYMLIFAIDLLLALKNPFTASKGQMKKYHFYGGLWSLLFAVMSHFDTEYALFGFCWIHQGTSSTKTKTKSVTSGIFFAVYIVIVYCTSLVAILRTWNTFLKGLRDTFKTRQRIHRHLKYYVGCYFGYWTLVLACYALYSVLPQQPNVQGGVRCRVWHLLSCLLLAKGMVNSLIWTRTSNILKVIEQLREFGYVDLPAHDDSINWALRLEILTNTTKGICESIDRAERQARVSASSASSTSSGEDPPTEIDYCERKESYAQIEEIILEHRNDRSGRGGPRSEGVVFYDYAPHVFRRLRIAAKISCASYRHSLRQTTKERVSEGKSGAFFYFTEDRKYVVKTMTHEELKFLLSMLPTYYTYIKANPNTFVTRFFGCHALTMYGKTVFFMVMQSVFDTTLQIHERFDLKGSWVGRLEGRKPTGTIATCKFCNAEYTVGGSHDQLCDVRRGEWGNLRHQYDQVGKDLNWNRHMALPKATARHVARQLTKDSNFLCKINCIDYSLLVGIHHRSFNVSHYSSADNLELGDLHANRRTSCCSHANSNGSFCMAVSTNNNNQSFAVRSSTSKPFHQAMQGGMTVDEVHGPGIYFMGLIDILQQWNFRKRVEHFVRVYVLMQDRHGISVVNPKQYAERFQQRVIKELIYDGDDVEYEPTAATEAAQAPVSSSSHDLHMFESGRTLSTILNSFDMGFELGLINSDRAYHDRASLPLPAPLPISVKAPSSRKRAATTSSSTTGPPPRHDSTTMSRSSFQMVYPHQHSHQQWSETSQVSCILEGSSCCSCASNASSSSRTSGRTSQTVENPRRPLAPLTPSPRISLRSEFTTSVVVTTSSSAPPSTTSGPSSGPSSGLPIETLVESPHGYRIVQTPTFPSGHDNTKAPSSATSASSAA